MAGAVAAEAAGGFDLTSLFVSVVPSFAGMGEAMKGAGGEGAKGFQEGFKESFHPFENAQSVIGEGAPMFARAGGEAAEAFSGAFSSIMNAKMPNMMGMFDTAEGTIQEFVHGSLGEIPLVGAMFSKVFDGMLGTLDAFKGPAGEFVDTLLQMGEGWQETARTIAGQTLDTGQIPELLNTVRQLGAEGVPNLEVVSKSIGQVHARLGELDDEQLKEFMKTLAQGSELLGGVSINTEHLTGVMNAFKIAPEDATKTLNELINTARGSGMDINMLTSQLERSDVGLSAFGFNIAQAGTMLSDLNKEGLQAPRMLMAFQTAAEKFRREGLVPKEGFKDLMKVIHDDIAKGTDEGANEAVETLKKFFGPRNAELIFKGIKDNLINLPDLIKPMEGMDEGPEKALEATETLEDKLKSLKNILDSALEPLEKGMADAMTRMGSKVSEWINTHKEEIITTVHTVLTEIVTWTQRSMHILGEAILAVAPYLNVIKSITVGIGDALLMVIQPLVKLGQLAHLPGMDDANKTIGEMRFGLQQLGAVDITKYTKDFGKDMVDLANQMPKVQNGLDNMLGPMEANARFSDSLKQNITDATTHVTSMQDAFKVLPGGGLQMTGNVDDTWDRLNKLGINFEAGQDGVVTKLTSTSQLAAKQFQDWYKSVSGKDLKIGITVEQHDPQSLENLMTGAGVPQKYQGPNGVQIPMQLIPGMQNTLNPAFSNWWPSGGAGLSIGAPGGSAEGFAPLDVGGSPATGNVGQAGIARAIYNAVVGAGYKPQTGVAAVAASMLESGLDPNITNKSGHHGLFQESSDKPSMGAAQQIQWFLGALSSAGGPDVVDLDPLNVIADKVEIGGYPGSNYSQFLGKAISLLGFQKGGNAELPQFSAMQQPIPGDWHPGQDSVHGVLEVGEYVVRRTKAQQHKSLLDKINFGEPHYFQPGGGVGTGSSDYAASGAGDDSAGVNSDIMGAMAVAHQYGLKLTAGKSGHGTHEVDRGYHDSGAAGDFSNGVNTKEELAFAIYMIQNYGTQLAEVIHASPYLPKLVKDGKLVDAGFYGADTLAGHHDHVHIAIKPGDSPQLESMAGPNLQIGGGGPGGSNNFMGGGGPGGGGGGAATGLGLGLGGGGGGGIFGGGAGHGPTPAQQREMARADEHVGKIKAKLDEAEAALNAMLSGSPEEQALNRNEIEKARAKRDKLQEQYNDALQSRNDKQLTINEHVSKTKAGMEDPNATQLGSGLVKGVFQELGFPDIFGKDPSQWGITKLLMGGLGWGMNMLMNPQLGTGTWFGGGGGGGEGGIGLGMGGGGGLGSALGGVASAFGMPMSKSHPAAAAKAMAPSGLPVNQPIGAPGAPGGNTYVFHNADQQTAQANWNAHNDQKMADSRQTALVGGAGGPLPA